MTDACATNYRGGGMESLVEYPVPVPIHLDNGSTQPSSVDIMRPIAILGDKEGTAHDQPEYGNKRERCGTFQLDD